MPKTATGTTTQVNGIIPFGSSDESIIYQHPLTSTPTGTGAGSMSGTGVSFDDNGMDTHGTGHWMFDLSTFDYTKLSHAGQWSLTVRSKDIGDYFPRDAQSIGADGVAPSTYNDTLASWGITTGTPGTYGQLLMGASQTLYGYIQNGLGDFAQAPRATSFGKDELCVVTFSWNGGRGQLYIDGAPYGTSTFTGDFHADIMKYFWVGGSRNLNSAADIWSGGRPMKDFIISKRPVMLARHPMLRSFVVTGDSHSQIWGGSISSQVNGYDHSCWFQFAAELAKHGLTCKPSPLPQATYGTSGGTVSAYSGATRVNTKFSAVLSKRPSVIINLCGTNDVNRSDFNLSAFETDMKADINTLLAVDASTELLVLWTIPSLRGVLAEQSIAVQVQKKVQTAQANAVVAALPAWWDANNLGREGAVVVVDMHTAFGGEDSAGDSYISGTWNPAYYVSATARYGNDVHPSSKGRRVMARLLASAIVNSL